MPRRPFAQLYLIQQLHPFLDWEALLLITNALVTPQLDYCNMLYMGLLLNSIQKLQLTQNATAQEVLNFPQHPHIPLWLQELLECVGCLL